MIRQVSALVQVFVFTVKVGGWVEGGSGQTLVKGTKVTELKVKVGLNFAWIRCIGRELGPEAGGCFYIKVRLSFTFH